MQLFKQLLILTLCLGVTSLQARPYQVEDLIAVKKIHDAIVSPDGRWLVYGVTPSKESPELSGDYLYLQDLTRKNQPAKQITSHQNKEHNIVWHENSKSIYFLADRHEKIGIWQLDLNGGEALAVTDLARDIIGFTINYQSQTVAMVIAVKVGCATLACTNEYLEKKQSGVKAYDQLMVRHLHEWKDGTFNHLFTAKIDKTPIVEVQDILPRWQGDILAKPNEDIKTIQFSPDGKQLVFSAKIPGDSQAWHTNYDLYSVELENNQLTNLTEANTAWDAAPQFSTNGRFLAYLAMKVPGYEADRFALMLKDFKTGTVKEVSPTWQYSVKDFYFAEDNRSIFVTTAEQGETALYEVNTSFGDVKKIYQEGSLSSLQVVADAIYVTKNNFSQPSDFYRVERNGDIEALTQINTKRWQQLEFGEYEQFSFTGADDDTVSGWLIKPVGFKETQQYPLAFLVHGGPQGSFANRFHPRWNAQLWAAQGYAVVMIDFHGSIGYGQEFTDAINQEWGGKPFTDLQLGLSYIEQQYPWIDHQNSCALGASYGGYMMNWIAGQWPERFRCLVNHAGILDLKAFTLTTEELWFPEQDLGNNAIELIQKKLPYNPVDFIAQWKTPMLITHGQLDFRIPYTQSLAAFTVLRRQEIPARLVLFEKESHGLKKPENIMRWYSEVFTWMTRWTGTKESTHQELE